MTRILQIILDTNILVAAFRSRRGAANLLLDKLKDSRWQVNVSTPLLLEYEDVLKYDEVLGVHIIGPHATELLAEACVAMALETTADEFGRVIHARLISNYPVPQVAVCVH